MTDTASEVHMRISEVTVSALPEDDVNHKLFSVKVSWRGGDRYAVERSGQCLGSDGEWDYEVSPSEREDEWNATHRFSYDQACALALQACRRALTDDDPCARCGHPTGPHALIATLGNEHGQVDPMKGGIMLCPVTGCMCYGTWGAAGRPAERIPPQDETDEIRRMIHAAAFPTRRNRREGRLRATDMPLSMGHPFTCNGGNPDFKAHHDHEVVMEWTDDDDLRCPECGRVQILTEFD